MDSIYLNHKEKPPGLFKKPKKSMNKIVTFIQEAKEELLKVNWPTKKQTINYTLLVVAVSLAVAGFLGGLDSVFGYILRTYIVK
jgi:preprotein translocase subunit SecE